MIKPRQLQLFNFPSRVSLFLHHQGPKAMFIPNDAVSTIPLTFTDQFGRKMPTLTGAMVASSDTSMAAASLSSDGSELILHPNAASGDFTVTYTLPSTPPVTTTFSFEIAAATPNVGLDEADATYAAK